MRVCPSNPRACQPRAPACRWGGQSAPRSPCDRPHPHLRLAGEERRPLGRPPGSAWKGGQASWVPGSVQRRREAGLLEAGGETRPLASREKSQPMVGIRQPPLLWGNQLSSKEPGDVGDPSSLAQRDSGGAPAGRGASGGLPEDALGDDPPRWGQGVCVDGCHPYGRPGRGRLVPAWQMSEWESESL